MNNKKNLITTAIDYVNASPHLGHALEKISADVIARYRRLKGEEVLFLAGTDENSLKNVRAAEKQGIGVNELVDKYAAEFFALKNALNLSFDDFIRTTEKRHILGVQKLWLACQHDIFKKSYAGLYCVDCEKFYKERELVDGLCPEHKIKPELISEENYFFRLSKYSEKLKKLIETNEIKIIPETRKNEILSFINQGLEDICISRSSERAGDWGINVPNDSSQKIWVWFDALSNYINALGYADNSEKFQEWWQENKNKLHIIGKDILRFHAVYWPGILMSAGLNLPDEIFAHGFITINSQKMSKSLANVINPLELVKKYDPDSIRYFLLAEFPLSEDGDFSYEKFENRYNGDLANGIGNLFERVFTMAKDADLRGYTRTIEADLRGKDEEISAFYQKTEGLYRQKMDSYEFYGVLGAVLIFAKKLDQYINSTEPWKLIKNKNPEAEKILTTLIFGVEKIINWLKPFMPSKMEKAEKYLKNLNSQKEKLNLFPRI